MSCIVAGDQNGSLSALCNLYSMTRAQEAVRKWFGVDPQRDRLGNQPPLPGIFPAHDAPVIHKAADGAREAVRLNWGFVLLQPGKVAKRVTNARWDKVRSSGFWKSSLADRRCLVPATSLAEPDGKVGPRLLRKAGKV